MLKFAFNFSAEARRIQRLPRLNLFSKPTCGVCEVEPPISTHHQTLNAFHFPRLNGRIVTVAISLMGRSAQVLWIARFSETFITPAKTQGRAYTDGHIWKLRSDPNFEHVYTFEGGRTPNIFIANRLRNHRIEKVIRWFRSGRQESAHRDRFLLICHGRFDTAHGSRAKHTLANGCHRSLLFLAPRGVQGNALGPRPWQNPGDSSSSLRLGPALSCNFSHRRLARRAGSYGRFIPFGHESAEYAARVPARRQFFHQGGCDQCPRFGCCSTFVLRCGRPG